MKKSISMALMILATVTGTLTGPDANACGSHGCGPTVPNVNVRVNVNVRINTGYYGGGYGWGGGYGYGGWGGGYGGCGGYGGGYYGGCGGWGFPWFGGGRMAFRRSRRLWRRSQVAAMNGNFARATNLQLRSQAAFARGMNRMWF